MTIRNLEYLFKPGAIATIGTGKQPDAFDAVLVRNLMSGGFRGPIMPVNPDRQALEGALTYKNVASLPVTPDLAVITTPLESTPTLISELGARGTRAVVLLSDEPLKTWEDSGQAIIQSMLDAAKPYLLRLVGPDCLGVAAPPQGVNATLSPSVPVSGHIGLLTQSCAVMRVIMDRAASRQIGFSHLVSVGVKIDVDFGDLLDYLALDNRTRAILLYLESIDHARKFMSAARIAARIKPVIVLKPHNYGDGPVEDAVYDIAYALPPLNMGLARELMSRTRVYAMLSASQGRRADVDAIALTLIKVSQLAIDLSAIVELDINPLWADTEGVTALDASIRIAKAQCPGTDRLAIRPYPKELEQHFTLPDGRSLSLRPIMPEDEPSLQAMVRRTPAEDLRLRFFRPIKELSHAMAARLTQIDYDREMAFSG